MFAYDHHDDRGLLYAIEDNYKKSEVLSAIAQSLAQSNKPDEGIKAANAIADYYKSEALSSVAQSLAQSNKADEAIQMARSIEDNEFRLEALSSVAQSLAQSNRLDEAAKLFDEARRCWYYIGMAICAFKVKC